ncbi:MAG: hypothetical protein DRP13_01420 [Candidatus Aenigmatarchaeota archaeon]|nr:MAG: hypothetical protein DRP13_01420 [Candidatus Aenigmarchaeota archaeon]
MIKRIRLKNWKSHLSSEFLFSQGVNALIGIMGSGKSSVMQGISFVLFGTFPELQTRKVRLDDLIMRKPQQKETAEIEIEFVLYGKTYYAKRVIEKGKGTTHAEVREEGRLIDVNPKNVTEIIERITGIDYDLFSKAVYSEQNALDYFLRIPKGQRMEHIDRMLKLDRFELARSRCVFLANKIDTEITDRLKVISDLEKEGLEKKTEEYRKEIEEIEENISLLENKKKEIWKEKEKIQSLIKDIEEKEKNRNQLKLELQGLVSGIKQIESSLEKKKQSLKDYENIGKEIETVSEDIKRLEEEIKAIENTLQKLRDKNASVRTQINAIVDETKRIDSLGTKCPVCESEITPEKKKKLLLERSGKKQALEKELETATKIIQEKEKHKQDIDEKLKAKILKRERLLSLKKDIDFVSELEERKEKYLKRIDEIEKNIKELEMFLSEEKTKKAKQEFEEVIRKETEIKEKLFSLLEREKDKKSVFQDLNQRFERLKEYKREVKTKENASKKLKIFEKVLKITQNRLREEFLKKINEIMRAVWTKLYPYADFSEVRLEIDKDYVLQLKGKEGWVSVDGTASGGERSMACLALRIAFSLAFLPKLKWLILDEPTHNLDDNAIQQFVQALRENLGGLIEQVFLITHDERVSEGIQGSLYRLERNKDENEPTQVISS